MAVIFAEWSDELEAVALRQADGALLLRLDATAARELARQLVAAADRGEGHWGGDPA